MDKKLKCEILKVIKEECKLSVKGAQTGKMLHILALDELLKQLDRMDKEGLIRIGSGKDKRSKGREDYGNLIMAGNITLTYQGQEFLDQTCRQAVQIEPDRVT